MSASGESKPFGAPRTDALFHQLSQPRAETPMERRSRVEYGLLMHAVQLEKELMGKAPRKGNYRPGTPLNEILKDCWSRSFTMEQTLQEVEGMGFKVDASLVTWFNGQWDADFQREMSREDRADKLMEQAQVFASAWASVDGPFDTGTMLATAKKERENLRKMILEADRG